MAQELTLKIEKASILRLEHSTDKINLSLGEKDSREIHGKYFDWMGTATLILTVTHGRGEEAIRALGYKGPYELIDNSQKGPLQITEHEGIEG